MVFWQKPISNGMILLDTLRKNINLRKSTGEAGRSIVARKYSLQSKVHNLAAILDKAILCQKG